MSRSRSRRQLPLLQNVSITDVAAEGKAVARLPEGGMVVFVPFAAPGDVADIQIDRKRKNYAEGHIARLIVPSPDNRVEPRCAHFTVCGGCKWQHLPYSLQLKCKQQQVVDAFTRIGHLQFPEISPIIGANPVYEYRNKLEYTFSNRKWLTYEQLASGEEFDQRNGAGFHISGAFDKVLDIEECHLQEPFSNRLRLFIRQYGHDRGLTFFDLRAQQGLLRTLMVRTASTGEKMALLVFGEDRPDLSLPLLEAVKAQFPEITSLLYTINTKANDTFTDLEITTFAGKPFIEETMKDGRLRFRIGPKSFYQTNSHQAERLYQVVADFAGLQGSETVYDLYTGTGTIAQFLADSANRVIGIEYVADAIADAKINAGVNGLSDKTDFFAGDMKDVLTDSFIEAHGQPDLIVIDPPRAGMHPDVVETLLRTRAPRMVYVSCNPATQARDLALLNDAYQIDAVQPVDMFPHTAHVENVALLTLRTITN